MRAAACVVHAVLSAAGRAPAGEAVRVVAASVEAWAVVAVVAGWVDRSSLCMGMQAQEGRSVYACRRVCGYRECLAE